MKTLLRALIVNLYLTEIPLLLLGAATLCHIDVDLGFFFEVILIIAPAIFFVISVIWAIVNIIVGFRTTIRPKPNVYETVMRTKISLIPCAILSGFACWFFYFITWPASIFFATYLFSFLAVSIYLLILASSAYAIGYSINRIRANIGNGKMKVACALLFIPILDIVASVWLDRKYTEIEPPKTERLRISYYN